MSADEKRVMEGDEEDVEEEVPLETWLLAEAHSFARRFVASFFKGAAVYAGATTFSALMKNPFRNRVPNVWTSLVRADGLRFAAFLGLYPSLYHLTVSALHRYRKHKDGWNYGVAGGLAGLSLAVSSPSYHKVLALFITARALGAGATTLVARGLVKAIPHAETLVFCTECALAVTGVACYPSLLPRGYYLSVLKWSRDYTEATTSALFRTPGNTFITCSEAGLHEGSCTAHALRDFLRSFPSFAKLYLPIHLTPVVLFKRNLLKKRPAYVLKSLVKNLTMSTLFLSTMVFVAKYAICLLRHASGRPPPLPAYIPFMAGFLCGLAILWERSSRRKELIMFMTPQILSMLWALVERSCPKSRLQVPHAFVLLFATAMAVVMHAYERDPPSLSMLMSGMLRFFVGERREKGPGSPQNKSVSLRQENDERKVA